MYFTSHGMPIDGGSLLAFCTPNLSLAPNHASFQDHLQNPLASLIWLWAKTLVPTRYPKSKLVKLDAYFPMVILWLS